MWHKTTTQYCGSRSSSFPSAPFCICWALDWQVNFSDWGHGLPSENIPGEAYLCLLPFIRCSGTEISIAHISSLAVAKLKNTTHSSKFSMFVGAQLAHKDEISRSVMTVRSYRHWRETWLELFSSPMNRSILNWIPTFFVEFSQKLGNHLILEASVSTLSDIGEQSYAHWKANLSWSQTQLTAC